MTGGRGTSLGFDLCPRVSAGWRRYGARGGGSVGEAGGECGGSGRKGRISWFGNEAGMYVLYDRGRGTKLSVLGRLKFSLGLRLTSHTIVPKRFIAKFDEIPRDFFLSTHVKFKVLSLANRRTIK